MVCDLEPEINYIITQVSIAFVLEGIRDRYTDTESEDAFMEDKKGGDFGFGDFASALGGPLSVICTNVVNFTKPELFYSVHRQSISYNQVEEFSENTVLATAHYPVHSSTSQ